MVQWQGSDVQFFCLRRGMQTRHMLHIAPGPWLRLIEQCRCKGTGCQTAGPSACARDPHCWNAHGRGGAHAGRHSWGAGIVLKVAIESSSEPFSGCLPTLGCVFTSFGIEHLRTLRGVLNVHSTVLLECTSFRGLLSWLQKCVSSRDI
jgi:hypothetical protein